MKSPTTRIMIGVGALVAGIGGGMVFLNGAQANGGVLVRASLVLGAVWFAWPAIIRVDPRWIWPAVISLAVAVTRPALLLWILPLSVALGVLTRKTTPTRRR